MAQDQDSKGKTKTETKTVTLKTKTKTVKILPRDNHHTLTLIKSFKYNAVHSNEKETFNSRNFTHIHACTPGYIC